MTDLVLITDKKERSQLFLADDTLNIISFEKGLMAVDIEDLVSGAKRIYRLEMEQ